MEQLDKQCPASVANHQEVIHSTWQRDRKGHLNVCLCSTFFRHQRGMLLQQGFVFGINIFLDELFPAVQGRILPVTRAIACQNSDTPLDFEMEMISGDYSSLDYICKYQQTLQSPAALPYALQPQVFVLALQPLPCTCIIEQR